MPLVSSELRFVANHFGVPQARPAMSEGIRSGRNRDGDRQERNRAAQGPGSCHPRLARRAEQVSGALVNEAQANSPAAKVGIKTGDVIGSVDGQPIHDSRDLAQKIGAKTPGTSVHLEVMRDGKSEAFTVALGAARPVARPIIRHQRRDRERRRQGRSEPARCSE